MKNNISSTRVPAAIGRLEAALSSGSHPLADPRLRPEPRDRDLLTTEVQQLFGLEPSGELLDLWGWWPGHSYEGPLGSLRHFERQLPGGLLIYDLATAYRTQEIRRDAGLDHESQRGWLLLGEVGGRVFVWCDLSDPATPETPVIVVADDDEWVICRFSSIAALLEASAELIETGRWTHTPQNSWHYSGPGGEAWFP